MLANPPSVSTSTPTKKATADAMIVRQAIVNVDKEVIGYALFNHSRAPSEQTFAINMALLFTALSHAGSADLVDITGLFVNRTHERLMGGHLELLTPEKVVLKVAPLGHVTSSEAVARLPILRVLRERGFKLSFNHTVLDSAYATWLPLADFIKLDVNMLRPEQLAVLVSHAKHHSNGQLIAAKVETAQQFELLKSLGVTLFQGYWFSHPAALEAKLLPPSQVSIIQLINLLRRQASTDEIEEVLKKDACLAFNLMQLINSTGFGGQCEITSFRQAVMIAGFKKLFRSAALLLAASQFGSSSASVGHTAVIRGRLMELLALKLMGEEQAELAFVVGFFSLLDVMLSIPLPDALQLIHVPTVVTEALMKHKGPLAELLRLAKSCESSNDQAFDHAALTLQLTTPQINAAHLQALAWCDQMMQHPPGTVIASAW